MADALREFLEAVTAGDDACTEEAVQVLGHLGDTALAPLRDLLNDTGADRRWWAVRAVAAIATPAARELLVAALDDADESVRACAAQGLGELGAGEAVAGLVRCLADPSPFVARIAADSLARIGVPAVPTLIAALQGEDVQTRAGAARALSIIRPQEAIPALCAALDDTSAAVTYYAEEALEKMGVGLVLFPP
jgi:HEAT repeat protein